MYRLAAVTLFGYALSAISVSTLAGDVSTLTAIASILMTTCATEVVLYVS